jgi:hypothetical protein
VKSINSKGFIELLIVVPPLLTVAFGYLAYSESKANVKGEYTLVFSSTQFLDKTGADAEIKPRHKTIKTMLFITVK